MCLPYLPFHPLHRITLILHVNTIPSSPLSSGFPLSCLLAVPLRPISHLTPTPMRVFLKHKSQNPKTGTKLRPPIPTFFVPTHQKYAPSFGADFRPPGLFPISTTCLCFPEKTKRTWQFPSFELSTHQVVSSFSVVPYEKSTGQNGNMVALICSKLWSGSQDAMKGTGG